MQARAAISALRRGGAAFLLAVTLAAPAGAQSLAQRHTAEVFSVANVPVDATAASANAARDAARIAGEREAYRRLIAKLTLAKDAGRVPPANDAALNDLIEGFEVANERRSNVRYLAEYTFQFRPDAVRQLLRNAHVPFAETLSKPVVVLPVLTVGGRSTLWDDPNPWRNAWNNRKSSPGLVPVVVPLGEAGDVSAIDANAAIKGDAGAIGAVSRRANGADVMVAHATVSRGGASSVEVSTTRYFAGGNADPTSTQTFTAAAGEDEAALFQRAIAGSMAPIEERWKAANMLDLSQTGTLTATVPVSSLMDWTTVNDRLAGIPAIQKAQLLSLDRKEAHVAISYVGDLTQLRLALAQRDLDLRGDGPDAMLAIRGASPAR